MEIKRLFVGELHTNAYVITNDDTACVVDPGGDIDKILNLIGDRKVDKILLTHGHFDHTLAADELREKTGAPIYISEEDAKMLEDADKNLFNSMYPTKEYKPFSADKFYDEKVSICGEEFEVMKTPGHSKGSVCLYKDKDLFSGDTLFLGTIGKYENYDEIMHSLWTLMFLEDDVMVRPGHGFATTIGRERNGNPFLK